MTFTHSLWVNSMTNQKKSNQNQDTTRFEIAIYSVLHERSNITVPFAEHLKIQEKLNCTHSLRLKRGKTIQDTIHFENALYRVLHDRNNITASFAEHLKFQEKMTFAEVFWVKRGKTKQKKENKDTIHFQITKYRVLYERGNIIAPFAEHLKFQE